MQIFSLLPLLDWFALAFFFIAWGSYSSYTKSQSQAGRSLIATTNVFRRQWIAQSTVRDPRVLDGIIVQNLSTTPAFFCSTTIIVIGGLFALLGSTDKAADLVKDLPFAQRTSLMVFDFKVFLLVAIFVFAFFRFSWSMRQYTFVALMIGSMPAPDVFEKAPQEKESFVERTCALVGLAAETFNDGLRAYYFAFAAIAWFFSPLALMGASVFVVLVLYSREYRSDVLRVLS